MDIVNGICNWDMTIRKYDDHIAVVKAVTCDEKAFLPDTLYGLPVTEILDYALSPKETDTEGEKIRIVFGKPGDEWDNKNIEQLTLPKQTVSIGKYAFLNCTSLESMTLSDGVERIGTGAFMNCRALRYFTLERPGDEQGIALYTLAHEFSREIDVTVEGNNKMFRLIFPEYYETHIENEPTHFFTYTIEGAGFPYHNVFRQKKLYLEDYDGLFNKFISSSYEEDTAVRLAFSRIRYPEGLSNRSKEDYISFLRDNFLKTCEYVLKSRDLSGLKMLIELIGPGKEETRRALDVSRNLGFTEATALLLERNRDSFKGKDKKYEF